VVAAGDLQAAPAQAAANGVLLVVTPAEELAKRIESSLRNAGHPLRVHWSTSLDEVEELIKRSPPDLVLADRDAPAAPFARVLESCRLWLPDLPVVLLGAAPTLEATVSALAAGARDLVSAEDAPHLRQLERVVLRELAQHGISRKLRQTETRLADFEARHVQLTDSTGDAVGVVQEGILARANLAFARLLGFDDPEPLAGQPLIDLVDPAQQGTVKERLRAVLKGKHVGEPLELRLVGKDGLVEVKARLILGSQDGESVIELLIRSASADAAPRPAAEAPRPAASSSVIARGRAAFRAALSAAAADGGAVRAALLLRIDGYSGLEERLGLVEADELIGLVNAAIESRLAPGDTHYGFSIDEIALIIRRADLTAIEQFAELLRRDLHEEIFSLHDSEAQVSLTIALFQPSPNDTADTVIRQLVSDARATSLKGGNKVVSVGLSTRSVQSEREEARIAGICRRALAEDRMRLAFQSIASLEGDSRGHFDLLIRMVDDEGREWTASEFLPAAQKFNLMRSIDRWVIGTTLDIVQRRREANDGATLFIKLSEDSLRDAEAFIVWLRALLNGRKLRPDEVVFQAQELVIQNHIRKARTLTRELVELGAGFAIEHFGIGSNSKQMLDHIPAHFLKFHASYTQSFGDQEVQKRLGELVEAAKQHKMKTIVSHVEDANVMARLWQMGVNFIQGYHVQEPEVVLLSEDTAQRR